MYARFKRLSFWSPNWQQLVLVVLAWLVASFVLPAQAQLPVVKYDRIDNHATFLSLDRGEIHYVDTLLAGAYAKRGEAFGGFEQPRADTVPVYRFFNAKTGAHFYTANAAERAALLNSAAGAGWNAEGIAFYAYLTPAADRVAVGRVWDRAHGVHQYLVDPKFELALFPPDFAVEGVVFYGVKIANTAATSFGRDAARFLTQTTFGVQSASEIAALEQKGYRAWLNDQLALTPYSAMQYLRAIEASGTRIEEQHPNEAIWQHMLFGDDQLRARVTFALSQIFVISNIAPDQNNWALASWWDMLSKNAFGNYRQLLEDATLHPAMGYYLNMMGNAKEDPTTGRSPNENYAREVLQLFSVGLNQLNADGSLKRDANGAAIATYDQKTVENFAKVFTGWTHGGNDTTKSDAFDNPKENWLVPMQAWPSQHSSGAKVLLNGVTVPANQPPEKDLRDALDNIANHPNVGPFISKRLIQALVTSNPSPAYVARVAGVFANNGAGVRGDLSAVIAAIVLDAEARSAPGADTVKFYGKQREPVLRYTQLLRGTKARADNGRNSIWWLDSADDALGQSPLLAPSVFNFFSPFFTKSGPIAAAGLVAPEFQITTEAQAVGSTNFLHNTIWSAETGSRDEGRVKLDFSQYAALEHDPAALVDALAVVFTSDQMSTATRRLISDAIATVSLEPTSRTQAALSLMIVSPEYVIQR